MATQCWYELHGTAKTQWCTDTNKEGHTLLNKASQKSVTSWDRFPTLCWLNFFFPLYSNVMIIQTCFCFKASEKNNKLDLMTLCISSVSWEMCEAAGAEWSGWCPSPCGCTLCPHCEALLVPWMVQGIIGLHRLI